jgi:hypothetical protein
MKKLIKTLLILAIIAVAMMFTRPEREKHVEKLTSEIVKSSQEKHDNEDTGILQDLGNALLGAVSEKLTRVWVNSQLEVTDYKVINVGRMYYKGSERVVTIGAFKHVFCPVEAYDLLEEMDTNE